MASVPIQRIHRLPDAVINQIAAGEVIERPVSVVKELLENSLDAGARHITVDVRGGGGRLIRVVDDGYGIHPDDLRLAIDRHTTNKLTRAEDLARIGTLGFRGEALSSMAAVSRVTLTSRQAESQHGWTVIAAGTDDTPDIKPAAHPVGTTVEVRDLFYNTPARKKFLRSDKSEFMHVQELVKRIVLSRPYLTLRLVHNNREVLHLSGAVVAPEDRMRAVLGRQFAGHCVRVQQHSDEYVLSGWLGMPEAARSQSDQQYFYLNGRSIRDKLINHAVRLACQDKLYPGRHPAYLLYLEMGVDAADVNVHPAKHEVRFRDPRNVHDFIYGCLVKALTGQAGPGKHEVVTAATIKENYPENQGAWRMSEAQAVYYPRHHQTGTLMPHGRDGPIPLLLVQHRYIVAEDQEGMIVVDSLRARELITLMRLRAVRAPGGIRSRPVLVPLVMPVSSAEEELLDQHQSLLAGLGLVLGHSAPSIVMVRELPLALAQTDAMALLKDVIVTLKSREKTDEALDSDLIELFASHANDCPPETLTLNEMQALVSELQEIKEQIPAELFKSAYRKLDRRDLQNLFDTKS